MDRIFKRPDPVYYPDIRPCSGVKGFESWSRVWTKGIGLKIHEKSLQTARNLPEITAITEAARTIDSAIKFDMFTFPARFFQDAPEDRLLTLKHRVQSLDVFLEFGILVREEFRDVCIFGEHSNVEQAKEMFGRILTDFNNAEDVKMAQRDTAARTHQRSNASEGVEGSLLINLPQRTETSSHLYFSDEEMRLIFASYQASRDRAKPPLPPTDQHPAYSVPPTATLIVVPTNLILQIGTEKHETQLQTARNLPEITAVTELNFFVTPLDTNTNGLLNEDYDQRPAYPAPTTSTSVVVPTNLIPQIGTEKHKTHLQTGKNLPGINAVTGRKQYYKQKTYLVTGLSEAAIENAVRTIELRVVSVTVRFPGSFFQDAPEDRQLTLRLHVESSHVVLTFSGDTQSTDVLISVEGVDSNVEQATEMLLKIKTDFIYAEDVRRARQDTANRKHQGSNVSEGIAVVAAKPSASPQEMANECIICVDIPANTAFIPCGHKTFCEPCARQIFQGKKECPTCRGRVTSVLRLFG
ncbi:hypothetical protein BV898_06252 [Hypsibius exemplaris]|uniref:RING-type domain-containing protein n=1 Tax=Hypsibius exemplaris TaxID=2072580 RepID=A0A1W0WWY4_HYPEX|nr:hypothetical protein BV898_06252 [Hypsibius exemplaris]